MESNDETLARTLRISEENNKMLRSLLRRAKLATAVGIVRWVIIILLAFGGFFVLQSYMSKVMELYSKVNGSAGVVDGSQDAIRQAIEQWKAFFGGSTTTDSQ